MINALPDKGERFRTAIAEIEKCLVDHPSTPMDCESLANQFDQMTMSTDEIEKPSSTVFLQRNDSKSNETSVNNDFSDERLNDVKQRLKARQAQRQNENHFTSATLITLDEAIRLHNEEKRQNEVRHSALSFYRSDFVDLTSELISFLVLVLRLIFS